MTNGGFSKVAAQTATEVCEKFELSEEAQPLLRDDLTPEQFLQLLIEKEQYADAAHFLALALPKREATWWACLCARSTAGDELPPDVERTLRIAEQWVYTPSEENRQLALSTAGETKMDDAISLVAAAAGWSGGSLNPPDDLEVPPPETLTANAAFGAVMLAGAKGDPQRINDNFRDFLARGIDIANGGSGKAA